jgi:hypothetical protein
LPTDKHHQNSTRGIDFFFQTEINRGCVGLDEGLSWGCACIVWEITKRV